MERGGLTVHTDVGDMASQPHHPRALFEGLGYADRLDDDIGAEAVRQILDQCSGASVASAVVSAPMARAASSRDSARSTA
ncbi:hypothetical protein GCM10010271_46600 [Streptomyces kurssanovii]|nr:hypothetical protein GCM10010271_46600 [Streptomyces kurssanovii]